MRKSHRRDEERHREAVRSLESNSGAAAVPDLPEPSSDGPRGGGEESDLSGTEDPLGRATKEFEQKLIESGGLGYYLMVIMAKGRTESFKGSHKRIDGFHFYAHLLSTLSDDVKQDLAPYLCVRLVDEQSGKQFGA